MGGSCPADAALRAWFAFLKVLAVVEPGLAFDLRGDPPQFVESLKRDSSRYYGHARSCNAGPAPCSCGVN